MRKAPLYLSRSSQWKKPDTSPTLLQNLFIVTVCKSAQCIEAWQLEMDNDACSSDFQFPLPSTLYFFFTSIVSSLYSWNNAYEARHCGHMICTVGQLCMLWNALHEAPHAHPLQCTMYERPSQLYVCMYGVIKQEIQILSSTFTLKLVKSRGFAFEVNISSQLQAACGVGLYGIRVTGVEALQSVALGLGT